MYIHTLANLVCYIIKWSGVGWMGGRANGSGTPEIPPQVWVCYRPGLTYIIYILFPDQNQTSLSTDHGHDGQSYRGGGGHTQTSARAAGRCRPGGGRSPHTSHTPLLRFVRPGTLAAKGTHVFISHNVPSVSWHQPFGIHCRPLKQMYPHYPSSNLDSKLSCLRKISSRIFA